MVRRHADTRDRIIERARGLLHCRGLEGFSYRDISTFLGIRNAAVHYHFPSKDDLTLALIESFTEEVREEIRRGREAGVPPRELLEVYFSRHREQVRAGCPICVFGAAAASYDRQTPQVQAALKRLRRLVHDWLAETLEAGRAQGTLSFEGSGSAKANQISAAIQGARQLASIGGGRLLGDVLDQFRRELYGSPDALECKT